MYTLGNPESFSLTCCGSVGKQSQALTIDFPQLRQPVLWYWAITIA